MDVRTRKPMMMRLKAYKKRIRVNNLNDKMEYDINLGP
jgi:hypothetical protein